MSEGGACDGSVGAALSKTCTKCSETKSHDHFYKCKAKVDGLSTQCKRCHKRYYKSWYKTNSEKNIERAKRWRAENPEKARELDRHCYAVNADKKKKSSRRWRAENPEKAREHDRKSGLKKYGITESEYTRLLEQQNHRCACCNRCESEFKKKLDVDHAHDSGKIRGLLCSNCNTGIGKLGDTSEGVRKALTYLERSENEKD